MLFQWIQAEVLFLFSPLLSVCLSVLVFPSWHFFSYYPPLFFFFCLSEPHIVPCLFIKSNYGWPWAPFSEELLLNSCIFSNLRNCYFSFLEGLFSLAAKWPTHCQKQLQVYLTVFNSIFFLIQSSLTVFFFELGVLFLVTEWMYMNCSQDKSRVTALTLTPQFFQQSHCSLKYIHCLIFTCTGVGVQNLFCCCYLIALFWSSLKDEICHKNRHNYPNSPKLRGLKQTKSWHLWEACI